MACEIRGTKLGKKFLLRSVREAEVGIHEYLIEQRSAEKPAHLLFLDGITRHGEDMAVAGENGAGDPPIEREKEGEIPFLKGNYGVAAAKLYAIGRRKLINVR